MTEACTSCQGSRYGRSTYRSYGSSGFGPKIDQTSRGPCRRSGNHPGHGRAVFGLGFCVVLLRRALVSGGMGRRRIAVFFRGESRPRRSRRTAPRDEKRDACRCRCQRQSDVELSVTGIALRHAGREWQRDDHRSRRRLRRRSGRVCAEGTPRTRKRSGSRWRPGRLRGHARGRHRNWATART